MVKKLVSILITGILMMSLAACGNSDNTEQKEGSAKETVATEQERDTQDQQEAVQEEASQQPSEVQATCGALVVYFSWSGNTKAVAESIQSQTGADIFEIVPADPYTDDYNELLDIAQEEQRNDARPEISGTIDNIDAYSTIYLGFPNWWGDMPMILYSFLDEYDLSGKTILPFCTSGGSGFSGSIATIQEMEPDAEVIENGLSVSDSGAANPDGAVTEWLGNLE
mgnify:FL=1